MGRAAATALSFVLIVATGCTSPDVRAGSTGAVSRTAVATSGVEAPVGSTSLGASPSPSSSASPSAPVPTSVELAAPGRATFLVHGVYPRERSRCVEHDRATLTGRYPGSVTVERADDGTYSLTVSIPFEDYLRGIAEVPPSWPTAALEAQAIAARSYALASTGWTGEGDTLPNAICSTSSCQVYRGVPLVPTPGIERWYHAVRRTRGEILVDDGRPAQTFYFSTSNGHTYGNEDVFGGPPLPYLRPVVETDDGGSPTSHWSAHVPLDDVGRFLAAAGDWPSAAPVTGVRLDGGSVVVDGDGTSRTIDVAAFRDDVNAWASCLEPERYPQGGLPTTIPSIWFSLSSGRHAVTVTGRGWGHGVGMVQYGAYGKALRGWTADQILSFYYGGFEPQAFPEPGVIDVEVASGLEALRVLASRRGATANGEALDRRSVTFAPDAGPLVGV
jgi:stage II sporulation protein D